MLRAHLRDNGVGLDGVVTVPGPSGAAAIVVDARAENSIVVAPGANAHLSMASADVRSVVAAADVVLLQLEIPMETALAAARLGRDGGALVVVNASPAGASPDALEALAGLVDVVVLNDDESRQWHWPVPHLVITRGADGATHVGPDGSRDVAAPAVEASRHHRRGRRLRRSARRRVARRSGRRASSRLCGRRSGDADTGGG